MTILSVHLYATRSSQMETMFLQVATFGELIFPLVLSQQLLVPRITKHQF